MLFEIRHSTEYLYAEPVLEACGELRLTPPSNDTQRVLSHDILIEPAAPLSEYRDACGNLAGFFAIPYRHPKLIVRSHLSVRTCPPNLPPESLSISVSEACQILRSRLADYYQYAQETRAIPAVPESKGWAEEILRGNLPLGEALAELNHTVHRKFEYRSGVTDNSTPLSEVWRTRRGVCQDLAHVMLGVIRAAGLPARYVCGYIETNPPPGREALLGAVATHAWVEVLLPGLCWAALDPTNDQWCGERHVAVSFGRDYSEAAPIRGVFKGSVRQELSVSVEMRAVREEEGEGDRGEGRL